MSVYRDGRRRLRATSLLRGLVRETERVGALRGEARRRAAVRALVLAGELEVALADAGHPAEAVVARATDHLAAAVLGASSERTRGLRELAEAPLPPLEGAPHEGFAYYALHPEAYARAVDALDLTQPALVVGVRSIGAPLSAVVAARIRERGLGARRVTVRPHGPPYDRRLELGGSAARAVLDAQRAREVVVVVDEGPGLSGSTLLAAAEAIVRAGVEPSRVVIACARELDAPALAALAAPNAAARFAAFRRVAAPGGVRAPAGEDLGRGAWRARLVGDAPWPACWPDLERGKVLVAGRLVKYEGLGPSGDDALARASALAEAGVSPPPRDEGDGWVSYPLLAGRPLAASDLDDAVLHRLATYCAARLRLAPAEAPACDLRAMTEHNLGVALGGSPAVAPLPVERPVVADGRMLPHEWMRGEGPPMKVDGASHGDDHLLPGPTDIAWDLAGTIVEWELGEGARARFLEMYQRASGDDPTGRLRPWLLAYLAFRIGWTAMALAARPGQGEAPRLERALARYRARASAAIVQS